MYTLKRKSYGNGQKVQLYPCGPRLKRNSCVNSADCFCRICNHLTPKWQKRRITKITKVAYAKYFGYVVDDQDQTGLLAYDVQQIQLSGLRLNALFQYQ